MKIEEKIKIANERLNGLRYIDETKVKLRIPIPTDNNAVRKEQIEVLDKKLEAMRNQVDNREIDEPKSYEVII